MCGYLEGPQDNWLFTQHISKDVNVDYDISICINITYRVIRCLASLGCVKDVGVYHYITDEPLPEAQFTNTDNYTLQHTISPPNTSTQIENVCFTLSSSQRGFYLAFRDQGSCFTLWRIYIHGTRCPQQQIGLVLFPETQSPSKGSADRGTVAECVRDASPVTSLNLKCDDEGAWDTTPVCECNPGYRQITGRDGHLACEGMCATRVQFRMHFCS